jgi:hypothetical protein
VAWRTPRRKIWSCRALTPHGSTQEFKRIPDSQLSAAISWVSCSLPAFPTSLHSTSSRRQPRFRRKKGRNLSHNQAGKGAAEEFCWWSSCLTVWAEEGSCSLKPICPRLRSRFVTLWPPPARVWLFARSRVRRHCCKKKNLTHFPGPTNDL